MIDDIKINAHSSIKFSAGAVLYFDPFHISEKSSDADIIFVTHDHYDHFSPEDIEKIVKDDTVFVAPRSTADLIRQNFAIPDDRIFSCAPGDSFEVKGIAVEAVAAYNPNKPQFHPKKNNWVGYVVTIGGCRYYICGDMDITAEGSAVSCDVVLVPCGGTYTMNVEEAAELVGRLSPKIAIPTHYGDIVGDISCGRAFEAACSKTAPDTKVVLKIAQ